ncbi:MAG: hypothetical protein JWQ87_5526 [Candidatus Sulfotelmatobacter sp.]|nr:hypothetical protein [Candidatus Sulfotelmatobacter sp.]
MDVEEILKSRTELDNFGNSKRLLFALETRFQPDDILAVAANSLTDGTGDKKCDLVYVDASSGVAIVAQGYEAGDLAKQEAPANKASDLNTAAGWLLTRPLEDIPPNLRSACEELRKALTDNAIRTLQFWYVHNLPESDNVRQELITVEGTASSALKKYFPKAEPIATIATEVGRSTLANWYKALETPILVSDTFEIETQGGYEMKGKNWAAYVTAVRADWLHTIFNHYKSDLFSANLRGYLGSREKDSNINHGIKETASTDPDHLFVFNNGITVIVSNYEAVDGKKLKVSGFSVVNGAQTTGAIGSLEKPPDPLASVQVRFIKCSDTETVLDVIQYNNSQNRLEAADFRSNDPVQKRLREEFSEMPQATYLGGRRGGHEDIMKRTPNLLPTETCAQSLLTFHQEPVTAYNDKTAIWANDGLYARYFSDHITAEHILFTYSLMRAVEARKAVLRAKKDEELKDIEREQVAFFQQRGSTHLLTSAIAKCVETILNKPIPNKFRLSFGKQVSPTVAQEYWQPIVEALSPLCDALKPAIANVLNNHKLAAEAISTFARLVASHEKFHRPTFDAFAVHVISYQPQTAAAKPMPVAVKA